MIDIQQFLFSDTAQYLFEKWLDVPRNGPGPCPNRYDFSFEDLGKEHEENTALLASFGPTSLIIARFGNNLKHTLQQDLSGHNLLAYTNPEGHEFEIAHYNKVMNSPAIGYMKRQITDIKNETADFETLHLPMSDYNGEVSYIACTTKISRNNQPITNPALCIIPKTVPLLSETINLSDLKT